MTVSIEVLYLIIGVMTGLILFCVGLILYYKFSLHYRQRRYLEFTQILLKGFAANNRLEVGRYVQKHPKTALRVLLEISQSQKLHKDQHNVLIDVIRKTGIDGYYIKRLQSGSRRKRMDAVVHLSALPGGATNQALLAALRKETDVLVRLHLCSALAFMEETEAIPLMVATLPGAPQRYRTRVNMMLASYGAAFHEYLPRIIDSKQVEIRSLIIDFAASYPAADLRRYLLQQVDGAEKDLAYRATRTLGIYYYTELNCEKFLRHPDPVLRNIAILAMDKIPTLPMIETLLPLLADERSGDQAAAVISQIVQYDPRQLPWLIAQFEQQTDQRLRHGLAKVLSNRIEYILMNLLVGNNAKMKAVLVDLLLLGKTNGVIGFLGKNRTIELENIILDIIRPLLAESESLRQEFRLYLPERILAKLNETPLQQPMQVREHVDERGKLARLYALLLLALGLVPAIYLIRRWDNFGSWSYYEHLTQFVLDFNYLIAFYSIAVNASYLLLLALSLLALNKQVKYWRFKKNALLFRPRILPGISILAPAYNEEASILDSVNSLLSLHYPNYEIILINDGSSDNTLNQLIQHFQLEKIERFVPRRLQTRPVRGIYANRNIPKLIVIEPFA